METDKCIHHGQTSAYQTETVYEGAFEMDEFPQQNKIQLLLEIQSVNVADIK